jgi:hypothetical protein
MKYYAVFVLGKKYKDFLSLANYEKHLKRLQEVPNADKEKLSENMILKETPKKTIVQDIKDYISNCKIRKTNVIVRDLLLSASREYFQENDLEKTYTWVKANMRFLDAEFGSNLRFAVLHRDEVGAPHIHAIICPKFQDKQQVNVLSNDRYFGGRQRLVEWQDKYAEHMAEFGLSRGIERSKAKHKDIHEFYAYIENMDKIEDISQIDPKFIMTQNMLLKTKTSSLEQTLEDYHKYLRLEKAAHQKTKEEKELLQQENKNTKDISFMLDCCLEYLAEEKHISKEYISRMVEIAAEKGTKLELDNSKNKENERGFENER